LFQFLTGGRPQCTCKAKKKQWCTFSYSDDEEKLAKTKDSGGVFHLEVNTLLSLSRRCVREREPHVMDPVC
jgi:hypothetical protein